MIRIVPVFLFAVTVLLGIHKGAREAVSAPNVFVLHSPIQPLANQIVTYTASASDATSLIQKIVISEQQEELKDCPNGQHGCSEVVSRWTDIKTCDVVPPQQSSVCSVSASYRDRFLIRYRASATNLNNETATDGDIYFAAGAYPWPDDPIPIYVRGEPYQKIDLVFIPDRDDYGSANTDPMNDPAALRAFITYVTDLVTKSFFSEREFAKDIRGRRDMWNFYITYYQGDAEELFCTREPPPNWTNMSATVDSGVIVHTNSFRDCSGLGPGSTFSAEPISDDIESSFVTPVHELSHSVFSLADEYRGGKLFQGTLPEHNVFPDLGGCKTNADAHGWPANNCERIRQENWWRSDPSGDIMEDTSSQDRGLGRSDAGRYHWWYAQCTNGNC